jgi:hypothetical protein
MQEKPTPEQVRDHLNAVIQHVRGLSIDNLWINLHSGHGFAGSSYTHMLDKGNYPVVELCASGDVKVVTDFEIISFHRAMLELIADPSKKVYTSLRRLSSAIRHLVLWEYCPSVVLLKTSTQTKA